jgi:hypothetical protein
MVVEYDPGRRREEAELAVQEARQSLDRARSLMAKTRLLLTSARRTAAEREVRG